MPQPTNGCGDILVKERFAFIHRRNLDNFSQFRIMSKVLTLVLYMHLINGVCYIPFGVGYCLLQLAGSPEPRRGNYNSSHAFFFVNRFHPGIVEEEIIMTMIKRMKLIVDVKNPSLLTNLKNLQLLGVELEKRNLGQILETGELVYDSENEKEVMKLVDKIILPKSYNHENN